MSRRKVQIRDEAGKGFVDTWKRAERGEGFREEHMAFKSWDGLPATLSPKKRIELPRFARRHPSLSLAARAR
jgi:predicted transcriptional regulator